MASPADTECRSAFIGGVSKRVDPIQIYIPRRKEIVERHPVVLACDPGESAGAAALSLVTGKLVLRRIPLGSRRWTQSQTVEALAELLREAAMTGDLCTTDPCWVTFIERPLTPRQALASGLGNTPQRGVRDLEDAITLLARERCEAAPMAYRAPVIYRPSATEWRSALGMRTRGIGADKRARREDLKAASMAYLSMRCGQTMETSIDAAEAACVALYASGLLPRLVHYWGHLSAYDGAPKRPGRRGASNLFTTPLRWSV